MQLRLLPDRLASSIGSVPDAVIPANFSNGGAIRRPVPQYIGRTPFALFPTPAKALIDVIFDQDDSSPRTYGARLVLGAPP
jgi:hypothetical protein